MFDSCNPCPSAEGILRVYWFHIKYSKEADVTMALLLSWWNSANSREFQRKGRVWLFGGFFVIFLKIWSEYKNCSSCILHNFL